MVDKGHNFSITATGDDSTDLIMSSPTMTKQLVETFVFNDAEFNQQFLRLGFKRVICTNGHGGRWIHGLRG